MTDKEKKKKSLNPAEHIALGGLYGGTMGAIYAPSAVYKNPQTLTGIPDAISDLKDKVTILSEEVPSYLDSSRKVAEGFYVSDTGVSDLKKSARDVLTNPLVSGAALGTLGGMTAGLGVYAAKKMIQRGRQRRLNPDGSAVSNSKH